MLAPDSQHIQHEQHPHSKVQEGNVLPIHDKLPNVSCDSAFEFVMEGATQKLWLVTPGG